jgi:hypothetical protein
MPYPDSTYEQQWRNARVHPFMRARDPHKAALLAAAPDLLAAARLANQELIDMGQANSGSPALVALWAAIAKAEGRE